MNDSRLIFLNRRVSIDSPDNNKVNKIKASQTRFDLNQSRLPFHSLKRKVKLTIRSSEVLLSKKFWS